MLHVPYGTYPKVSGYPELPWYFILHTYFEKIILNSVEILFQNLNLKRLNDFKFMRQCLKI